MVGKEPAKASVETMQENNPYIKQIIFRWVQSIHVVICRSKLMCDMQISHLSRCPKYDSSILCTILEVTSVFIAVPSHPAAKLHYDHHLLDRDFDVGSEVISGGSTKVQKGGAVSLNLLCSIMSDRAIFGEVIPMCCRKAETIMAADSNNATSRITCFFHCDCEVVVIFSWLAGLVSEWTS